MSIINELKQDPSMIQRPEAESIDWAFDQLDVRPAAVVHAFYSTFKGQHWSTSLGFNLLDLIEGGEDSVLRMTTICRDLYQFPKQFLVISDYSANSVLCVDSRDGKVYWVDFEGGDEELKQGRLEPRWNTFEDFLAKYFST